LFPLNFRHLSKRMLLARGRKQGNRKENSEDALTNEGSHNALAQLSVSAVVRKDESAVVGRDRRAHPDHSITITITSKSKRQKKSYD
jgi:hypothetical protein